MDIVRSNIAKTVRKLRRARRWTQVELAARLDLSQSRLSELERGAGSFSAEQLIALVQLFNVRLSEFAPGKPVDENAELQNALARLGASHLREFEDVLPDAELDAVRTVQAALVSGAPRLVTALAPVIVHAVDRINLTKLHAELAEAGFENRLSWLIDNTIAALRVELGAPLPSAWSRRYRRAAVVLEVALEAAIARSRREPAADLLDLEIRSAKTRQQLEASASAQSRRWGIVSSLQPEDFVRALEDARVDH